MEPYFNTDFLLGLCLLCLSPEEEAATAVLSWLDCSKTLARLGFKRRATAVPNSIHEL